MSNPFTIQTQNSNLSLRQAAKAFPGSIMERKVEEIECNCLAFRFFDIVAAIILVTGIILTCSSPKFTTTSFLGAFGLAALSEAAGLSFAAHAFFEERKWPSRTYQQWEAANDSHPAHDAIKTIELKQLNQE